MAGLKADLYRALWVQSGAIIAAVAGLLALVQGVGPVNAAQVGT